MSIENKELPTIDEIALDQMQVDLVKEQLISAFKSWELSGKKPLSVLMDAYADMPETTTVYDRLELITDNADGILTYVATCIWEEFLA